ncbi:MAG: membrane integrity-associated transporter subunit PqiC [Proteobacteria bacterium]|nr:membrane integrity-associated transporter subunit PqiC [Pseudomonadota bacterium]
MTTAPGRPLAKSASRIELRDVRLAPALDRAGIVRAGRGTRIVLDEGHRWIGPLDEMVTRTLAADLAQRLPDSSIVGERDASGRDPDVIVSVDIDRFEADAAGQAVLSANFTIRRFGRPSALREGRIDEHVAPSSPGTDALVQALSVALGRLADRLAETLSA